MSKKGKIILLSLLSILLSGWITINFTTGFGNFLVYPDSETYHDPVTIDYLTIQTLMKAVSVDEIPVKSYLQAIDSLNQNWDLKNIRNPFIKKSKKKSIVTRTRKSSVKKKSRKRRPRIKVNGIVWDQAKPYAILNGEVYGVGDELKGYTIQSISDSIVVLYNAKDLFSVKYERE